MQAAGDASARERLLARVLLPQRHEPGHLVLRELDLHQTRRQLFGRATLGLGTVALAQLLGSAAQAPRQVQDEGLQAPVLLQLEDLPLELGKYATGGAEVAIPGRLLHVELKRSCGD